jgi:hypothetical protein
MAASQIRAAAGRGRWVVQQAKSGHRRVAGDAADEGRRQTPSRCSGKIHPCLGVLGSPCWWGAPMLVVRGGGRIRLTEGRADSLVGGPRRFPRFRVEKEAGRDPK